MCIPLVCSQVDADGDELSFSFLLTVLVQHLHELDTDTILPVTFKLLKSAYMFKLAVYIPLLCLRWYSVDLNVPEVCSQCKQTCPWNGRRCWCDTVYAWQPDGCSHHLLENKHTHQSGYSYSHQCLTTTGMENNPTLLQHYVNQLSLTQQQDKSLQGTMFTHVHHPAGIRR